VSKRKRKKLGYKEYEGLLSEAHQKLDILANKLHELQTYFIAYVEFKKDNTVFNDWMNVRIKEMQVELETKEAAKVNEKV
jgi:hypothetical protein|tara:strand:- start:700 stop:939 length:240 start_codon:yes stop_codon:yes gene_type:complete